MHKTIFSLIIFLIGCVENGLWLDTACTEDDVTVIRTAVANINDVGASIDILGSRDVDYLAADKLNDGYDTIYCVQSQKGLPHDDDNVVGQANHHDVHLYIYKIPDSEHLLNTVMHELGHYWGAVDLGGPIEDNVMSGGMTSLTQYSAIDIDCIVHNNCKL